MAAAGQLFKDISNTTALQDVVTSGWQTGPPFRGTAEILWSCIITIFACIYTAIHDDIPSRRRPVWSMVARKLHWAFTALMCPEVVLLAASRQWRAARQITNKLNKLTPRSTGGQDLENVEPGGTLTPGAAKRIKEYRMPNGFWIVMGGFVIDTTDIYDQCQRATLTAKGAELLAEMGLLPDFSHSQITDRSKANAIGKILVCLQASWMMLQCIVRHAAGYPLTLLEIHTMGHVISALCIYALWWNKPLDIEEPVFINSAAFQDLLALMLMTTVHHQGEEEHPEIKTVSFTQNPCSTVKQQPYVAYQAETHSVVKMKVSSQGIQYLEQHKLPPLIDTQVQPLEKIVLQKGQSLTCGITWCGPTKLELSVQDVRRFELAAQAIQSMIPSAAYKCEKQGLDDLIDRYSQCISTAQATDWIVEPSVEPWESKLPIDNFWNIFDKLFEQSQACLAYLLPMLWGALHLAAWNFIFPSRIEEILWKVSGIGIMALTLVTLSSISVLGWNNHKRMARLRNWKYFKWWLTSITVSMVANSLCRIYLVIECFMSLRRVPLGVWVATPWLQSFPHV